MEENEGWGIGVLISALLGLFPHNGCGPNEQIRFYCRNKLVSAAFRPKAQQPYAMFPVPSKKKVEPLIFCFFSDLLVEPPVPLKKKVETPVLKKQKLVGTVKLS